ncbi:hypothetical protein O9992_25525 [Vibrio lentus]|nr:hypothetical protein [Vibrio lentus]
MLLAPLIGKYIFKFHPALKPRYLWWRLVPVQLRVAMVEKKAKSNIPMLGYTVPYAVSNTPTDTHHRYVHGAVLLT